MHIGQINYFQKPHFSCFPEYCALIILRSTHERDSKHKKLCEQRSCEREQAERSSRALLVLRSLDFKEGVCLIAVKHQPFSTTFIFVPHVNSQSHLSACSLVLKTYFLPLYLTRIIAYASTRCFKGSKPPFASMSISTSFLHLSGSKSKAVGVPRCSPICAVPI